MLASKPYVPSADWAAVRRLPPEFAQYAAEDLVQLPAGAPGKTAFLQLHFERRGDRTHLIRNFSGGHQVVRQVHYLDPELPDMAVAIIQNVSAGVLQGDRLRIEITVGDGARVLVTNQAATKVFEMHQNYASQRLDVTVGRHAYAEILTDPVIPCRGARLYNEVNLTVDPTGALVYSEHLTPGRVAHGESWEFDRYHSRLRVERPTGELIVADTNVIAPAIAPVATPGLFGEFTDMAVLYAVAEGRDTAALAEAMASAVGRVPQVAASASVLPGAVGAHSRALAGSTPAAEAATGASWGAVRRVLTDTEAAPIYRTKHGFDPPAHQPHARNGHDDVT